MKKHFSCVKLIVPGLALAFAIFEMTVTGSFEFHRDELLYLSLGAHPAAGYYSVPPLIGILAFVSTGIFGHTLLAARFFPALAGGILVWIVSRIAREMKGDRYAEVLSALTVITSLVFVRAYGLFQPVCFDILFWTLALWLLLRYFNTGREKLLLWLGAVIGLAFLNKYNIAFLVVALIPAILLTRHRKIFLSPKLCLAAGIALVIITPNIIWQLRHGWPVVSHMQELKESQLVNMSASTFLSEQLLMVFPATFLVLPGLLLLLVHPRLKEYRVFGFFMLFILAEFLFLSGKTYYSAGIYPFLIAASAVAAGLFLRRTLTRLIPVVLILIPGILVLPMGKPLLKPEKMVNYFDAVAGLTGSDAIRRDEDNRYNKLPQDYWDMLGWSELTEITAEAWALTGNSPRCPVYCENYGQAGAIAVIGRRFGLPEPVSFSESFIYWFPRSFENDPEELIYINDVPGEDIYGLFASVEKIGEVSNPLSRERGTGVYLCRRPVRSFNAFWQERTGGIPLYP